MNVKILHTADWHLGKRLDYFPRISEQREILNEICDIADQQEADIVIVAGDLFDTFNPSTEAVELLYKTLKRLTRQGKRPVIALAGNHDSPDRIDATDPLARACGIVLIGSPLLDFGCMEVENYWKIIQSAPGFIEIQFAHIPFPIRLITTPYANELRLKQYLGAEDKAQALNELLSSHWQQLADSYCDEQGVNILTTHLYMQKNGGEILEEPEGEKPLKIGHADLVYTQGIPTQIQYTALGHLHRYHNIGSTEKPIVYSSSPLSYSFAEAGQQKNVVLIQAKPQKAVELSLIPLQSGRPLYRKSFDQIDDAVLWLREHPDALVELTLISDSFLSSVDLKRIHEAHDGIIYIIPVVATADIQAHESRTINLQQDIQGLFKDFFKSKQGQDPNEEILSLFQEVIAYRSETEN